MERTTLKKNDSYRAEILSVTAEGLGICRIGGMVVFVPQTAAGDECDVKIVKVLSRYAYGIATAFHRLSSDRVEPDCPVYRQCGGCCFRHLHYDAELAVKEAAVHDAFERLGKITVEPEPILASPKTEGYRNKAQYPVGKNEGGIICGFYANRSHRIIPSANCPLQPEIFSEIVRGILPDLEKAGVLPYDEETGKGELRHIYLRIGEMTNEIMLCFICTRDISSKIKPFVEGWTARFPSVKSIVLNQNDRRDNVILGERCIPVWGKETVEDILCGLSFSLSPLSFYQVNRSQTEQLYALAKEYAELTGNETVIDLYCGVGTIGLSMADRCGRLFGVEIVAAAIENAKKNAERNRITNAEFLCADAKAATAELRKRGERPDVVILDPPRKGCDAAVVEDVAEMAPKRIVMISCNPSTAARDCKLFEEKGYRVEKYRPVDMFPRTQHVETVVLLSRKDVH